MARQAGSESGEARRDGCTVPWSRIGPAFRARSAPLTVSRDSTAGRVYNDLQREARSAGRPVQEIFQLYILEAFLERLSRSVYRDRLVLKGGVLLAAFGERRPTRDVDFQAQAVDNETEAIRDLVIEVASIEVDDGVEFDTETADAVVIRDEDLYAGVRVSMAASLARAKHRFHVDVNVGDPIKPPADDVEIPRLLGGTISLRGYPIEMVHAEKIVTAIARGTVNTRWRDFVDVVALAGSHSVDAGQVIEAVRRVAEYRGVELRPLADVLAGYGEIGQARWAAWRRKQLLERRTPESFDELLREFITFAGPVAAGSATGSWNTHRQEWADSGSSNDEADE